MSFIKVTDPRKREELIKDFIETRKRIKDNFIARKVGESEYQTGLTKLFKPVTETQKATAKEITDTQKEAVQKITGELLPIREGLENITVVPPIEAGEKAMKVLEDVKKELIDVGPIAAEHISLSLEGKGDINGIKWDSKNKKFKIGSENIEIENNDIILFDERYKGTPGLWNLITSKNIPDISEYEAKELYDYIYIMANTNTAHIKNDPTQSYKSGNNNKFNNFIKPFVKMLKINDKTLIDKIEEHFKEETEDEDALQPSTSGTGLKILPSDPNTLIDRFDLLFSSQNAGHTGVRNEIISILDELKRQGVINTNEYKKLNSIIKK